MWKSLSVRKQLYIVLLIPVLGLIYISYSNFKTSIQNYNDIEKSIHNIENISILSNGISHISNERALYNYSFHDSSKKPLYYLEKQKTIQWLSKIDIKNSIVKENLNSIFDSIRTLHSKIDEKTESQSSAFVKYASIIKSINYIIDNEIIDCETHELSKLAFNYNNYIFLKRAALLKRGIALQFSIDKNTDKSLIELYNNARTLEEQANFNLTISEFNDINSALNTFIKSKELNNFNYDSKEIIENNLQITPQKWWKNTSKIITSIVDIENKNLEYILESGKTAQDNVRSAVIKSIILLSLLLIVSFIIILKLIQNLSNSLANISKVVKKLSIGEIIENPLIKGNKEFNSISVSFNQLLRASENQIDLSKKISLGEYGTTIKVRSDNDALNNSLNKMSVDLLNLNNETTQNRLLENNVTLINKSIVESKDLYNFGQNICETVAKVTNGCQAVFYLTETSSSISQLNKIGSFANDENSPNTIKFGEGLVGEAAKLNEQLCYNNLPKQHSYISSSLGKSPYYNVLITPISYKNTVIGVLEIGSLENFEDISKKLLRSISESVGSAIEVFTRNEELKISLEEINKKNNILQVQEEELRQSNEELNKQTLLLQQSEEELRNQAAELEQTNAYLEEKGNELEHKNSEIIIKNEKLLIAQDELNKKAEEIAKASKYKSEFLANMSHELRTPLNSILILSDLLKENVLGNLSDTQIENLSVINSSGKDLLNLITDILDISKIEAGKVEVYPEKTVIQRVYSDMENIFHAQMQKKQIKFNTTIADDCPNELYTDIGKLEQIIKNFLSNALKFTPEKGEVKMSFKSGGNKTDFASENLSELNSNEILCVEIEDNGIGISDVNKKKLFQTFQQGDSSTSRKYGGTGLGLYISKELASILGGEVTFESELNKGSIFRVFIPKAYQSAEMENEVLEDLAEIENKTISDEFISSENVVTDLTENLNDDRAEFSEEDKTILIIEDDESFAEVLLQVARDNGFKGIVAYQGETGFQYAKKYNPKAIILDMKLPGVDGWTVLKWLKEDKDLKHIPVHVMSGMNREKLAKEMGAFDFLIKPVSIGKLKMAFDSIENKINSVYKKVLILEDNVNLNNSLKELVQNTGSNIICYQAHNSLEAKEILKIEEIDCAIIDIGLPDSKSIETVSELKNISRNEQIKIIVNTGKDLTEEDELQLQESADGIVIKSDDVTERLKDELMLFLHKVETFSPNQIKQDQNILGGQVLNNKKILIADDDIRNIYSLSSALKAKDAVIFTAFNGLEAIDVLEKNPDIDIILMDIMMPEMNGYEATIKIRENIKWKNIPIIALTAKAMKGDREEIIKAGASDYLSKPIDIHQLISLISIWVYK